MIKNTTTIKNGILKWGKKELMRGDCSNYYDLTYYKVPFSGTFDAGAIRSALAKLYPNTGNYFGGYTTVGNIEMFDKAHAKVELVYHIGE